MNRHKLEFGIKNKSLVVFIFIFVAILLFNGYLGITILNQAKEASLKVGNTVLLEQSRTYFKNYTTSQTETLGLLLKTIEDDVNSLKQHTTRLFSDKRLFENKKKLHYQEQLEHLPNNQLVGKSEGGSVLWSPTWMKVDEAVLKKIEVSAQLNEYFDVLLQRNDNTTASYFIGKEGFLRYYPRIGLLEQFEPDFRMIDGIFYEPAVPKNNPLRELIWTPLYKDPAGLGWMISAIAPVYVNNEFIGVVGTDLTLKSLVKNYIRQDSQSDSYSILLDKTFRPIALPEKAISEIYQNPDVAEQTIANSLLTHPSQFQSAFNEMKNQKSGFVRVELTEKVRYISYIKLAKLDWTYANILSEKEILSATKYLGDEIDAITKELIVWFTLPMLVFFIILSVLISWLLNRFLRPIITLSGITRTIAYGHYDYTINVKANDEVAVLVNNFKAMQQAILKHRRELEGFNDDLQEKVAHRTEAIEASNEALQTMVHNLKYMQDQMVESEKMASLGTLTAGVAHEINNPTNFVHVSVQNLRADLGEFNEFLFKLLNDEDDEIKQSFGDHFEKLYLHITTIIEGTDRIKTIVQNLRTFTHPDAPQKKMLNVADGLQATINLIQTKHQDVTHFITDFKSNPALLCYPSELNQVFMNLIINACDAIKDKQTRQQSKEKGEVIIGCQSLIDAVEITVRDNGCGMDDVTKHRLFEPFFTTKDVGEGTGLGLSISYGIVQKHEGELSIESQVGVGTLFRLTLPVCTSTIAVDEQVNEQ